MRDWDCVMDVVNALVAAIEVSRAFGFRPFVPWERVLSAAWMYEMRGQW
jgi:hypothetical protein